MKPQSGAAQTRSVRRTEVEWLLRWDFRLSARGRRALRPNFSNAKSNDGSSTVVSSDDLPDRHLAIRVARGFVGKRAVGGWIFSAGACLSP